MSDCDCGCICADGYDLELADGTASTLIMGWVPPGGLEIDVNNGHIILPDSNNFNPVGTTAYYPLAWNGTNWTLDLAPYLTGRYTDYISTTDGSLVAAPPVPSGSGTYTGTATFTRDNGEGLMEITVSIAGTIASTGGP